MRIFLSLTFLFLRKCAGGEGGFFFFFFGDMGKRCLDNSPLRSLQFFSLLHIDFDSCCMIAELDILGQHMLTMFEKSSELCHGSIAHR